MVHARVAMALAGLASPAALTEAYENVFKKVVVAVTPALTFTAQVSVVNMTMASSSSGTQRQRHLLSGDGVVVDFAIAVDVRLASEASGKTYDITGAAGSDDWASSNSSLQEAKELANDVASAVQLATSTTNLNDDSGLTIWDATVATEVDALPAVLKVEGLSLTASPTDGVSVKEGSVYVVTCSGDNLCEFSAPAPTIALPSQVPTPAPSSQPEYTLRPTVGAATLMLLLSSDCVFSMR